MTKYGRVLVVKRLKLAIIILLMLPLAGCIKQYTATEKQTNAVAEYTAGLILEYDSDYNQALVPCDKLKGDKSDSNTATPILTPSVSSDTNQAGQTDKATTDVNEPLSISNVIGKKDFEIKYKSYKFADTYPDDSNDTYYALNHSKGYKLLVMTFTVKNVADSTKTLNLIDAKVKYQLNINTDKYSPLLSLLENNLKYFDMKIGGGKTKKSVLIFQVPDKTDTSNMSLLISNNDQSTTINLK